MRKLLFSAALLLTLSAGLQARDFDPAVAKEPAPVCHLDTTGDWYNPNRIYYESIRGNYSVGNFFDAVDLPTVFGVGFNPTGNEAGLGYYAQMFLEWRPYKTYGWFVIAGLDTHDQSYQWGTNSKNAYEYPTDWTPAKGVWVKGADYAGNSIASSEMNVKSGTVFNMDLTLGGGYRFPLVNNIREFYQHPYICKFNIGLTAQFGYAWSRMNKVTIYDSGAGIYEVSDINYFHPVMKFGVMAEWFTGPQFSIFLMATYMQHLTTMPWDNPETHAGTLAISVGFSGFFN